MQRFSFTSVALLMVVASAARARAQQPGSSAGARPAPAASAESTAAPRPISPGPIASADSPSVASARATVTAPVDRIIALVGDEPVLQSEIDERVNTARAQGVLPKDSAGIARFEHTVLENVIDEDLLIQEAKRQKISVTDDALASKVDGQISTVRGRFSSDAEYRKQLRLSGFGTPGEYRRWLVGQARRQALQQKLFETLRQDGKLSPAPVPEAQIDSFFQANKGQIPPLPATVSYREIVISPKPSAAEDSAARAKAESLLVQIRHGADFATLARRESMDQSTRAAGGDLGWHRRGEFVPAFDQMYFSLRPGQVSPVIKTVFGYHIIKVEHVQPSEVQGRHILIRPEIDSADVAAAKRLADSVASVWRHGGNYDSLAARFHDPSEEKYMPDAYPIDSLPAEYQTAIKGHKDGDILAPFAILDKTRNVPKYFVLQLTAVRPARAPSVADFRQQIRDQLAQQDAVGSYIDALRKKTYVSVMH